MSNNSSYPKQPVIPDFFCVGWVQSAHGIRGELFIRLKAGSADWAEDAEELHLLLPGQSDLRAYALTQMKPHKDGLIVRLKGVDDRNAAEAVAKSQVYIPEEYLEGEPGEAIYLKQIAGFTVVDKQTGAVGPIQGFSSNGVQDLLQVLSKDGREVLIPLVDAFLIDIDFDKKLVHMDLPAGLVTLEEE